MSLSQSTSSKPITIAVDAMGGDHAPAEIVKGAIEGARQHGVQILLVGRTQELEPHIPPDTTPGVPIKLVASEGGILEDEHPALALRQRPKASIAVATKLVKKGHANALVSMGSTGAGMACASLLLGLMEGLERPCVGGPFTGALAPNTVMVDLGSNVDCRPSQLLSFATMGCVLAHKLLGVENPRVGLLSLGSEESKGNRQVRESYKLFSDNGINFVGNIEGMDFFTGKVDVVVCDGFVGNILMKFTEGLGATIAAFLKQRLEGKLTPEDIDSTTTAIWETTNPAKNLGGGPLLGVNGTVVLGHGASKAEDVARAIHTARRCVEMDLVASMAQEIAAIQPILKTSQGE